MVDIVKQPKPPRTWKLRCDRKDCGCEWIAKLEDRNNSYHVVGTFDTIRVHVFLCPVCRSAVDVKHNWTSNLGWFGLWIRTPY